MFSWSNNSNSSATTTRSNYPGRRVGGSNNNSNNSSVHISVAGSIRPPTSSSINHTNNGISSSTSSTIDGGEITRAQHLQSYLEDPILQRSTRRVSSDDTTYDTVFQTTEGDTLILRVNLPLQSSFAAAVPAMTLAGVKVRHPWVDESKNHRMMRIIGYDPIQSETLWKESKMKLGDAVHAVVKHLQLNPPQILEITDKGLRAIQSNPKWKQQQQQQSGKEVTTPPRNGMNGSSSNQGRREEEEAPPSYNMVTESTPPPEIPMPTIPSIYPQVNDMSRQELDLLLDDELEFLSLVQKMPIYEQIFNIGSKRLNENVQLAKENLGYEAKLKELVKDVKSLQQSLQTKLEVYSKLEEQQNAICAPPDRTTILRKLHKAKKEAMDESETIAETWVEKGTGGAVDDFCKTFLETRKVHHMRAAKMEILKHMPPPHHL